MPGLRGALKLIWLKVPGQRCAVHKLRNLQRNAPKYALDELKGDYHQVVYAADAKAAHTDFVRKWTKLCPAVARSSRRPETSY